MARISPLLPSDVGYQNSVLKAHEFRGLRVLIVHDWLVTWGGAERCLEQIVGIFPDADVVVGVRDPAFRQYNDVTERARETWLGRVPGAHRHHRWFLPLEGLAFRWLDTRGYDLVISSSHALAKMVRPTRGTKHVCYCYTPPRYLWDLFDTHKRAAGGFERQALIAGARLLRYFDRRSAKGVDHFIAISRCVAERIQRCYERSAEVVYPPVVSKTPYSRITAPRSDFMLYLGRLVPYKRVDLAIHAAERLGVRMVVAGDGPERKRLEQLAGPMTEFTGSVSEQEAGRLLSSCGLFLFCGEEDFGIAPLEANAHGAPVVAYGRGGLLETMQQGRTAEFFSEQNPEAVMEAAVRALGREWDQKTLRDNASRFSPEHFREAFTACVRRALA